MAGALVGAMFGIGLLVAVSAFWAPMPAETLVADGRHVMDSIRLPSWLRWWQIGAAVVAGLFAGAITGFAAAAVAIAVGVLTMPALIAGQGQEVVFADKTEATAAWIEGLRDMMRGTRGIEGSLRVTAETAPAILRPELVRMNRRIAAGVPVRTSLARLADEVDNPVCDLVVAVLVNALGVSAVRVPALLDEIAADARDQAYQHLQIYTSRQNQRTQLRLVGLIVVFAIVVFMGLFRSYLAPLGSPTGQLVLVFASLLVGGMLLWLVQLSAVPHRARTLDPGLLLEAES